jgi:competence protein ComEC
LNILFISAIWMLLYDPFLLYNLSFQFSYLSLGSILLFYPFFRVLYIPVHRFSKSVWGLIAVSLSAQVLIFPISIYYFNQFPLYFIISSLIAIPLAVFLVYGGFALLIIDYLFGSIHPMLQWAYNESVSFLMYCIESIQKWPYAVLEKIWFDDIQVLLLYVSIFLLLRYLQHSRRIYYFLFLGIVFIVIFIHQKNYVRSVNQLRICVYDVSKGYLTDFFVGQTAFALVSNKVDSKREKMIASKNRMKNGIHDVKNLSEVRILNQKFSFSPDEGACIGNTKAILLSDQNPVLPGNENYDIVIISKGARLFSDWQSLSGNIRKIILCNNIKEFQRKQWLTCLEEWGIPYIDIKKHGYFEINLSSM